MNPQAYHDGLVYKLRQLHKLALRRLGSMTRFFLRPFKGPQIFSIAIRLPNDSYDSELLFCSKPWMEPPSPPLAPEKLPTLSLSPGRSLFFFFFFF
jgi:hypothetical protein